MREPGEIAHFDDRVSPPMRELLDHLAAATPGPLAPVPADRGRDGLAATAYLLGARRRGADSGKLEFGGRRPYHFQDERQSASGRWEIWMDAGAGAHHRIRPRLDPPPSPARSRSATRASSGSEPTASTAAGRNAFQRASVSRGGSDASIAIATLDLGQHRPRAAAPRSARRARRARAGTAPQQRPRTGPLGVGQHVVDGPADSMKLRADSASFTCADSSLAMASSSVFWISPAKAAIACLPRRPPPVRIRAL